MAATNRRPDSPTAQVLGAHPEQHFAAVQARGHQSSAESDDRDEGRLRALRRTSSAAPDLLGAARIHHHHPVRECIPDLVVRDIQARRPQPPVQRPATPRASAPAASHRDWKRLVEQEHRRLAHDRATHRDALALPARQLPRLALEQRLRARVSPRRASRARRCRIREIADSQAVGHVVVYGHVRVTARSLKTIAMSCPWARAVTTRSR